MTLAEWQAANKARGVHPSRSGKGTGLLSGVLRCGGCSYAMKPKMGKTRHGKDFLEYGYKPDKAGGRCPAPASVKASVIEAFVLAPVRFRQARRRARPRSLSERIYSWPAKARPPRPRGQRGTIRTLPINCRGLSSLPIQTREIQRDTD